MRSGWPIAHAFRLAIRFVPNDIRSKIPAIILQGEGEPPRQADQILRLQSIGRGRAVIHRPPFVLRILIPPCAAAGGIAIADVEP